MVGFDEGQRQLSGWEHSLAGAVAGAVTRGLCQPFDVLKTRFQLQVEPISKYSPDSKYSTVSQAFRSIYLEEGVRGLWKGHISGQLLSVTFGIVQFQAFEWSTEAVEVHLHTAAKSPGVHAICGTAAGMVATLVSFPFDVLRTRFIAQGTDMIYSSLLQGFTHMVKTEGPSSLYRGLTPTLLLAGPQAGAVFAFHNLFTTLYKKLRPATSKELDLLGNLVVGCLAGICGKTCVYPLDLSRKRLQLQGFQGRKGFGENFTCRNLYSCLVKTVKREGVMALFKGLSPSILKAATTTALHFTTYEETCKILARRKTLA